MSKAFTKDDDGVPPPEPGAFGRLPAGVPNYVTAGGYARLLAQVTTLHASGATLAAKGLAERLEHAQIIAERSGPGPVRFGDVVHVRGESERWLHIVGVDEVDLDLELARAQVKPLSWLTPLAKALLGAEIGDVVAVGDDELEVLSIA